MTVMGMLMKYQPPATWSLSVRAVFGFMGIVYLVPQPLLIIGLAVAADVETKPSV